LAIAIEIIHLLLPPVNAGHSEYNELMVLLVKAKYSNYFYFRIEDDFGEPMNLFGLSIKFQVINKKGEQVLIKSVGNGVFLDPGRPGVLEVRINEEESSLLYSLPQPLSYALYYEGSEGKVILSDGIITAYKFSGELPNN
jgi:hypothetical protein